MPKLKTKKALKKRVRITARGKVKRAKGGRSHLMRRKTAQRRLTLKKPGYAVKSDEKRIKQMLPYE